MSSASRSGGEVMQTGEHPRLDWLLDNWARYMRGYDMNVRLDAKTSSYWSSGSSDFDGMVSSADLNDAVKTNAAIEDLPLDEQCALHHEHLNAVWRFNREPWDVVRARARGNLSDGLRRRGVA